MGEPYAEERTDMTEEQLRDGVNFFGCVDEDMPYPGDVIVEWGDEGHSGPGWYMYCEEYPDEGATFVSPNKEPFPALAKLLDDIEARRASDEAVAEPGTGEPPAPPNTKTAAEWAASEPRGMLCSTEF